MKRPLILDCVLCGHELRDAAHHVDERRDVGHSPLGEASSDRFTRQPIEVPVHTGTGALVPWDVVKR